MAQDVRNTAFGQILHDYLLHHVAQGNDASVTIKTLERDGSKLTFNIDIRSRQVFRVTLPFGHHRTVVVYDETSNIHGTVDFLHPDPGSVNFSIDTPVGPIRFNLTQVLALLEAAA